MDTNTMTACDWIYWGKEKGYFIWCWYDSTDQQTTWQVTKEKNPPIGFDGYGSLESLLKLKQQSLL